MPMNAAQESAKRIMLVTKLAAAAGFVLGAKKDAKRAIAAGAIGAAVLGAAGLAVGFVGEKLTNLINWMFTKVIQADSLDWSGIILPDVCNRLTDDHYMGQMCAMQVKIKSVKIFTLFYTDPELNILQLVEYECGY
jgi:hypothetical protein